MTAIISFQIEGQPVMFGDLLLSAEVAPLPIHIPTVGDIRQVFPSDSVFTPVGLAQKIAVISDDFAVAWSGTQIYARTVIRELTEHFRATRPTDEDLRAYFNQLPDQMADDLTLLAMVAMSPTRMFHFGFGAEEENDPRFGVFRMGGSGHGAVAGFLRRIQNFTENDGRQMTPFAKAIGCALTMSGELLAREIFATDNLWEFFGGGYEVLTRVEGRWKKLDDVLTIFWVARQTNSGGVELVTHPIRVIRQAYFGDLLAIRALSLEPNQPIQDKLYVVDSAARPAYEWERQQVQAPDFNARWICHQFVVQQLDGSVSPRSRVTFNQNLSEAPLRLRWDGRQLSVEMAPGYLDIVREFARSA
jgi:hypothetical protein